MLKQHGQYLYQLRHLGFINMYLVPEDDGFTLVDTGIAQSVPLVRKVLAQLETTPKRIVITHAHIDHAGGIDGLRAEYPDVELAISRRDAKLLAGDYTLEAGEPDIALDVRDLKVSSTPDRLLEPGDQVGTLQVHDAKGHSPGQIALFDPRAGTLIAADAFVTLGGRGKVAVAGARGWARWRFPPPHFATWSPTLAHECGCALTELKSTRLAVGHGPVLHNPTEAMRRACALE